MPGPPTAVPSGAERQVQAQAQSTCQLRRRSTRSGGATSTASCPCRRRNRAASLTQPLLRTRILAVTLPQTVSFTLLWTRGRVFFRRLRAPPPTLPPPPPPAPPPPPPLPPLLPPPLPLPLVVVVVLPQNLFLLGATEADHPLRLFLLPPQQQQQRRQRPAVTQQPQRNVTRFSLGRWAQERTS